MHGIFLVRERRIYISRHSRHYYTSLKIIPSKKFSPGGERLPPLSLLYSYIISDLTLTK